MGREGGGFGFQGAMGLGTQAITARLANGRLSHSIAPRLHS